MFHIALYSPQIPPNTGSAARLCAASGAQLHLIHPLGFRLNKASMRRAGLDYWDSVNMKVHKDIDSFLQDFSNSAIYFITKWGKQVYTEVTYKPGDVWLFGSETRGLPPELIEQHPEKTLYIPMRKESVRSLNLATSIAVILYEALRQNNFRF